MVESFYARLLESAISSSFASPLLIFPSTTDVDSICAHNIIFHVLESNSLRYACYHVSSFREIHDYVDAGLVASGDSFVSVILINWGCHMDLRKVIRLGDRVMVFFVDSHQPIHLRNLSGGNDRVVVVYSKEDERQADLAYDFDVSTLADTSALDGDEEGFLDPCNGDDLG